MGEKILSNFVDLVINPAILVLFAAGFFMFVWGLVEFILNLEKDDNQAGKRHMLWGIVGMFVMSSVYGIIALLDNTFGLGAFTPTPDLSRWEDLNNTNFFTE